MILRGDRIVMPKSLWQQTVDLAHQGHQGIDETKARIRTKVWFLKVDDLVEAKVKGCHACIIAGGDPPTHPVITEPAASRPWAQVSVDFGSFPDGRHTVVIVDSHSKFPVVEVVSSTAFETLKPILDKVFALFGLPEVLRKDNGPLFQGAPFKEYLTRLGVSHRKITPQWPQANGDVERLMRTLNKALRIGVARGEDLEECLQTFLWAYRNTPHYTTKCAPSVLLMSKRGRDLVPASESWMPATLDPHQVQHRRQMNNRHRRAKTVWFQPRDWVVVWNRKPTGKFCTRYEPEVWEVVSQRGTMVTVQRGGSTLTRNVSWFKPCPCSPTGLPPRAETEARYRYPSGGPSEVSGFEEPTDESEDEPSEAWSDPPSTWGDCAHTPGDPVRSHPRYQLRGRPLPNSQLKEYCWSRRGKK